MLTDQAKRTNEMASNNHPIFFNPVEKKPLHLKFISLFSYFSYVTILLTIGFLLPYQYATAQNLRVPHNHFTPHDGLAGLINQRVFQDSRGYIWFAGNEGIAYFNGYEFKQIDRHPGFSTEFILFIEEDEQGRMMFLSETHLTLYDGREFKAVPLPYQVMAGFIRKGHENSKFFGLQSLDTLQFFELMIDSYFEEIPQHFRKGHRFELKDCEEVLFISGNKLYLIRKNNLIVKELDDFIRYGNHQEGALFFPALGYSFRQFTQTPKDYFKFTSLYKKLYIFPSLEEFYNSEKDNFILHRNPPGRTGDYLYLPEIKEYVKTEEFTGDFIWASFRDRSGQLWVSANSGLFKYHLNGIFKLESEPHPTIWGISEWQGRLLFHSYLNGLMYYEHGQWKNIPQPFSNGELFPGRAVSSEYFHFVPSWDGVFVVDKNFQTYYLETERFPEGLYVDTFSNQLIAADEKFLYFFDLETLSLRDRIPMPGDATRVAKFSIRELNEELWMSGPGGVVRMNKTGDLLNTYTYQNNKLPCKGAINVFIDEWDEIWVTGICGLMRWNSGMDRIEMVYDFGGDASLVDMIDIGESKYLISSNTSLYVIRIHRPHENGDSISVQVLKEFNQFNGFDGVKPYLSGFYRDSLNRIWVPTATGSYMMDTRLLRLDLSEASISLSFVDDKKLPFNQPPIKKFTLEYGKRNVNIGFEMVCFDWPGKPGFQYRLSSKGEWSQSQSDALIRLIDLGHGLHELEIRAVFTDRSEEDWPVVSTTLKVQLPFWERSWFPLFVAGLVLFFGMSLGGAWLYNRRIRLKQFQTHNQLQLLQIHALESQLNPHFIFNVLTNIQKKVVMEQADQANDMIVKLGKLMRHYLESVENGINQSNQLHKTSLASELELIKLYMDFEREKYRGKFHYRMDIEEGIDPDTTLIFPMLMQPFIENSIKHGFAGMSEEGEIHINIFRANERLCIEITDNGIGRAASIEKNKGRKSAFRSKGNLLVSRRVELLRKLGHNVSLDTIDLKKGTKVRIFTPVFRSK